MKTITFYGMWLTFLQLLQYTRIKTTAERCRKVVKRRVLVAELWNLWRVADVILGIAIRYLPQTPDMSQKFNTRLIWCWTLVSNSSQLNDYNKCNSMSTSTNSDKEWPCRESVKLEFGWRCRVRSRARRWLQLVGCAALLLDASNFGGPDGVGESGVEPRRSLRRRERVLRRSRLLSWYSNWWNTYNKLEYLYRDKT